MLCPRSTATYPDSSPAVSVQAHVDLFQGLAHDDLLRARLVARPAETLAAYGIHLDRQWIPNSVELPAKELVPGWAVGPAYAGFFYGP